MQQLWPLWGRSMQLQRASDALSLGRFDGVLVEGGPGTGKSRLAAESVASMPGPPHRQVRSVDATPAGSTVRMGALSEFVPSDAGIADAVSAITEPACGEPIVLTVDDAHLLDVDSAEAIGQAMRHGLARAVLTTTLVGEGDAEWLRRIEQGNRIDRIRLEPLARDDADGLVRQVLTPQVEDASLEALWARTRGNLQLLRHLVDEEVRSGRLTDAAGPWRWDAPVAVPSSLSDIVKLQLGELDENTRRLLELLAVAGDLPEDCATSLVPQHIVDDAARRGLTVMRDRRIAGGHPLYDEAILSTMSTQRRRDRRGCIVTALRACADHASVLQLARLWLASDVPAEPHFFTQAAEKACSVMLFALAEQCAREAVAAGGGRRAHLRHAHALHMLGRGEAARAALEQMRSLHEAAVQESADAVIMRATNLLYVLGDPARSAQLVSERLATATGSAVHRLTAFRAVQFAASGRPNIVVALQVDLDRSQLDRAGRMLLLYAETVAYAELGRVDDARRTAAQALTMNERSPNELLTVASIAEAHVVALAAAGMPAEAVRAAEHFQQHNARGLKPDTSMPTAVAGIAALRAGDVPAAVAYLSRSVDELSDFAERSGIGFRHRTYLVEALAVSGARDAAEAMLGAARSDHHPAQRHVEPCYLLATAWVQAVGGQLATARRTARQAAQSAQDSGQWAYEVMCLQVATQLGDLAGADRLGQLARVVDGPRVALAERYARAMRDGDGDSLLATSEQFELMGDLLAAADSAAHAARAYRLAERRGTALSADARASALAERSGYRASPALLAESVGVPFTARELEIALLVSRGLGNREIATLTQLSVRTVEDLIQRASRKAGAHSRRDLAQSVRVSQRHTAREVPDRGAVRR